MTYLDTKTAKSATYELGRINSKGQFVSGARKRKCPEGFKRCNKCLEVKPYEDFHKIKKKAPSSDGRRPRCKACRKVASAQDYINRGDFIRKQQREARRTMTDEQREHERLRIRDWKSANPELEKAYVKKYKTSEHGVAKRKEWEKENRESIREKQREWSKTTKGLQGSRRSVETRRARLANVESDGHTIPELHAYWKAKGIDPKRCTYCNAWHTKWDNNWKTSVGDHVFPIEKKGPDTLDNKMPCCITCNRSKGDRILGEEWTPPKDNINHL